MLLKLMGLVKLFSQNTDKFYCGAPHYSVLGIGVKGTGVKQSAIVKKIR